MYADHGINLVVVVDEGDHNYEHLNVEEVNDYGNNEDKIHLHDRLLPRGYHLLRSSFGDPGPGFCKVRAIWEPVQ